MDKDPGNTDVPSTDDILDQWAIDHPDGYQGPSLDEIFTEPSPVHDKFRAIIKQALASNKDNPIRYGTFYCASDEIDIQAINELLADAPSMHPQGAFEDSPFAEYQRNTEELWAYVAKQSVFKYLSNISFRHNIDYICEEKKSYDSHSVYIAQGQGVEKFQIPAKLFVGAAGFSSWHGREDHYGNLGQGDKMSDQGRMSSIDTIMSYAGRPTEVPSVGAVEVYVQPDGEIFATNNAGGGDSHRISAAILRGKEYIEANNLKITLLGTNVIL